MNRLHVLRAGSGPTILLLHGIGSSATAWSGQLDRLRGEFTCLAPDLPGYGDSPDPASPGLDAVVADVAAVLEGRPAHVVGVSFGALTALALARARPELVSSLVLSDATLGRGDLPADERERWLRHRESLAHELATRSVERAAEIAGRAASPEVIDEIARHMRRARPAGYLNVAGIIAATQARPWLAGIGQPALVLCGEDDRVTGLDVSRTLARELPRATLLAIAGAGHAPHVEQPDRFAQAVRAFLRSPATGPA
jgi:pimeloyl-ACP methyl ester carboxylesterase